jgi:hypothetical protein
MAPTFTLFEHEAKPFNWTDRDLLLLDRMRNEVGADVISATMRRRDKVIQASQYVGVVRLRNRTIQILPKIYRSDEDADEQQRAKEATRNLLYMSVANQPARLVSYWVRPWRTAASTSAMAHKAFACSSRNPRGVRMRLRPMRGVSFCIRGRRIRRTAVIGSIDEYPTEELAQGGAQWFSRAT